MAPRQTKQAKLDVAAHEHLAVLQKALGSQRLSRNVDRTDILSALVLYTTPPQLAGMLREYWWYTNQLAEAEAAAAETDSDKPDSDG